MRLFRNNFFQWKSISSQLSEATQLDSDWQLALFSSTMGSDIMNKFPVDIDYQRRFCKSVISRCEELGEDLIEEFYEKLGQIHLGKELNKDSYKTYFYAGDSTNYDDCVKVHLRETAEIISGGTTGLSTWTAGEVLARWLNDQPASMFNGARILELGAGSGVSGLLAVKRLTVLTEYVFSDCHGKVLRNLEHNVENNLEGWQVVSEEPFTMERCGDSSVEQVVKVVDLNWEMFTNEIAIEEKITPSIVLGADIVFDKEVIPSLVQTINILVQNKNCEAFIACTIRNPETFSFFLSQLTRLKDLKVDKWRMEEDSCPTPVYMVHIS